MTLYTTHDCTAVQSNGSSNTEQRRCVGRVIRRHEITPSSTSVSIRSCSCLSSRMGKWLCIMSMVMSGCAVMHANTRRRNTLIIGSMMAAAVAAPSVVSSHGACTMAPDDAAAVHVLELLPAAPADRGQDGVCVCTSHTRNGTQSRSLLSSDDQQQRAGVGLSTVLTVL